LAEKGVKILLEEHLNQYQQPLSPNRDKTSLSHKLDDNKAILKMIKKSSMKQEAREEYFAKKINNNIVKLL
jgi:hypothetical protein